MTQLQIETRFSQGEGSIELRPALDPTRQAVVGKLGIGGIENIVERNDPKGGETMTYVLRHTEPRRLDRAAATMAQALEETGVEVSLTRQQ